jgi:hypothetical protein
VAHRDAQRPFLVQQQQQAVLGGHAEGVDEASKRVAQAALAPAERALHQQTARVAGVCAQRGMQRRVVVYPAGAGGRERL